MRIAWIAVVLACGGSSSAPVAPPPATPAPVVAPKPAADPIEQALSEMEGMRTKMCACTDRACSDRVEADRKVWQDAMREKFRDSKLEPTDEQDKRGTASEKAYRDCRRKLAPSATIAEALVKMAEFKDKMCICKDKACAEKVVDEMTKWSQEMASRADADSKPSEDDVKKITDITEKFTSCATKLMTP